MLHREGPQRTSAGVRLFRGRAWPAHDGQPTHAREARRIAANIARLPTPLGRPAVRSQRILTRRDRRSSLGHLQRGRLQYLTTKQQLCHDRVEPFHFPVTAPVVGWSVHSAATLPIYLLFGFSPFLVAGIGAVCLLFAGCSLSQPRAEAEIAPAPTIPMWAFAAAGLVALLPAATILPKSSGDAVWLADAAFDHAKIAIIDAMARLGLPPVNPVIGEAGAASGPAYYYLWHFSAAEIALVTSMSGWEADVGLTWFIAFASLSLMMGLAVWLGKRVAAAIWAVALAAAGSLWLALFWMFQTKSFAPVLQPPIGMGGWLFQATWAPQHLMAASCVVAALLLVARYTLQPSLALVVTIALLVAAGFESSAFVGGAVFAVAGSVAAPILFCEADQRRRWRHFGGLAVAALLVVCLVAPFVRDQLAAIAARGAGWPIVASPYAVFASRFPEWLRHVLNIPGYWLIILPVELPATFVAGMIAFAVALRSAMPRDENVVVKVFACLAGTGLVVSWLLVSRLGTNNDLGLRAILPAEVVLIVMTAAGMSGLKSGSLRAAAATHRPNRPGRPGTPAPDTLSVTPISRHSTVRSPTRAWL
jgi:hypothetical protein